ncbi:MAG: heme-copper oxidase subunit III [Hyphomicrobiales bacterium]|nr:heme-copper oxidase subunit III [Hyphomicrobiales bacterium]
MSTVVAVSRRSLPVGSVGAHAIGWWGMVCAVLTEAALFGYLLFSYFYFAIQPRQMAFPPQLPPLWLAAPNTVILLASSVAVWQGERGARRDSRARQVIGLGVGFALGVVFVGIQLLEWHSQPFGLSSNAYGSLFFTVTGFHMAHVILGLLILLSLTIWSALGYFDRYYSAPISIGVIYWHFVDAVWLAVFFSFYITPYLGLRHGP